MPQCAQATIFSAVPSASDVAVALVSAALALLVLLVLEALLPPSLPSDERRTPSSLGAALFFEDRYQRHAK